MGQKVHPVGFRLGLTQNWRSRWFSKNKYQEFLEEDYTIRDFLTKKLQKTGLDKVEIERSANAISVILYSSRPGLLIGRGGAGVEDLKKATNNFLQKKFKRSFKN